MKRILCLLLSILFILSFCIQAFADDFIFCRKCGKQIPSDSLFCTFCGVAIVPIETALPANEAVDVALPASSAESSAPSAANDNTLPFFSKTKGFKFVEPHEYNNIPFEVVILKSTPEIISKSAFCDITKPEIILGKPDENNNITYTIKYSVAPSFEFRFPANTVSYSYDFNSCPAEFCIFDLYSGKIYFTYDENAEDLLLFHAQYENADYPISISGNDADWHWLPNKFDYNTSSLTTSCSADMLINITSPADYDGLLLGILDAESSEEYYFNWDSEFGEYWDDFDNIDHWDFIRIKDYSYFPSLQNGSFGKEVKELQRQLKDLGFLSGSVDGDFGPGTLKAVSAFQASVGLEETGIADDATQRALYGIPRQTASENDNGREGEDNSEEAALENDSRTVESEDRNHTDEPLKDPNTIEPPQSSNVTDHSANTTQEEVQVTENSKPDVSQGSYDDMLYNPEANQSELPSSQTDAPNTTPDNTPYGIPLYSSPEEVDLAVIFDGHSIKHLVDLCGNFVEYYKEDEFNAADGSYINTYNKQRCYFSDSTNWDEPQYIKYYTSVPEKANASGIHFLSAEDIFIYNSDIYHGNPYQLCISGGYKRYKTAVSPETIDQKLNSSFLPFVVENATYNITKAEILDGKYCVYFDVIVKNDDFTETVKYADCCVLIDPLTSLIHGYEYSYESSLGTRKVNRTVSAEVNYSIQELPDYHKILSEVLAG